MKAKYPCGCEYNFSGIITISGKNVVPDYVDDDGYDFELCAKHLDELTENWP